MANTPRPTHPGLTDIYALGDWLKKHYVGSPRHPLHIQPEIGGLITVTIAEPRHNPPTISEAAPTD